MVASGHQRKPGFALRLGLFSALLVVSEQGCADSEGYVGRWVAAQPLAASGGIEASTSGAPEPAAGGWATGVSSDAGAVGIAGAPGNAASPAETPQAPDVCRLARSGSLEVTVVDSNAVEYDFAERAAFPAGRYRINYVDGCRRYDDTAAWTVHASLIASGLSPQGRGGCYLVMSNGQALDLAPGTTGLLVGAGVEPAGAFASYDECVAANRKLPALEVMFAGGVLGVMNAGDSTANKTSGEAVGGRSPTYRLTRIDACP